MRIKSGFMLRQIAGSWVVVPLGQRVVEFNGLMTLSESGALIWKKLQEGAEVEDLVQLMLKEYQVDYDTAKEDVVQMIDRMMEKGLLAS